MNKPVVAAFDFDGTITSRDTMLPFLLHSTDFWRALNKLAVLSPSFIRYLLNGLSRQETKEKVLTRFFSGMPIDQFRNLGKAFAHSTNLSKLIVPEALKRLEWHQQQKHRCVLVSATIDAYLEPWSKFLGFDDLICSEVEVSQKGLVTGRLAGLNCWGPEKARRLSELLGTKENYILYAYGDSKGDQELLALADHPFFCRFD